MSLSYIEDGDSTYVEGEPCPTCRSTATLKEVGYGFWKCEDCSTVWGDDEGGVGGDSQFEECPTCLGAKPSDPEEEFTDCPTCGGTGYLRSDRHD